MKSPISKNIILNGIVTPNWRSYFDYLDKKIINTHKTPASVSVVAGGTPVGTIAGVQTWNDGSEYQVPEVAATPGFDVQFTFTGISGFTHIISNVYYSATTGHQVELQIYDAANTTWRTLYQIQEGLGYSYRYIDFPLDVMDYIDSSKQVKTRLYHISAGDITHDIYTDYLAIGNHGA